MKKSLSAVALGSAALLMSVNVFAVDAGAAEKLARKSGCLKCHAPEKEKDGPSMKKLAAKWKGKADAEAKLYTHVTTTPMVEIDGKQEKHETLKSTDEADIKNVVQWYLTH